MMSFIDQLPNPVKRIGEYQIVKTPMALAEQVLDGFPAEVWLDKDNTWLMPVSKNGVFEICVYNRLMKSLASEISDDNERRNWIVEKVIWSFAPTFSCELVIRLNYLSRVWNDKSDFMALRGNVQTLDFLKAKVNNGGVMVKDKDSKEKYVKIECVVGNPPYQKDSGDTSDMAFYPPFIFKAMELNPHYLSMVIPSKWMMGDGKGTADFLQMMISCGKLSKITSTKNSREWFPDIDLKGGAMYFLFDKSKNNTKVKINGADYDLAESDVILTDNLALNIVAKLKTKCAKFFDTVMCGQNPYGINTNHKEWSHNKDDSYICHCSGKSGKGEVTKFVSKALISRNEDTISKWKLCIAKNSGRGGDGTGHSFIINPGAITTQSYLVIGCFDSEAQAKNAHSYFYTGFAQFMSSVLKGTQNVSKRVFKYLPYLDFTRSYTDQDLYNMFDLSKEEIAHIENTTKDFPIFRSKKMAKVRAKFKDMESKVCNV